MVSLKSFHLKIGPDIDLVCPTSNFLSNLMIESSWMGAIWGPCSIQAGRAKPLFARLCACRQFLVSSLNHITVPNPRVQIWGSLEFGVRPIALYCHCNPPMQAPQVLPNIKLSYTPMSSENTHHSTVTIQDNTRFIVGDSIVLVIEPQISLNLKSVPVGLAMYFGEGWMQK